ncbi:MAG: electron transfer flavoprotein subunit beta/FixA family protein [Chloroflexi bacterium]|nr:electron transfer flavoprotein subunit beta/FixA family protein [Chloroflexota bacterium]
MEILVCIKRVPATGARIVITEDGQEIETRNLGFTISPHEECAVEEAVQLVEKHGGSVTALTLGPETAVAQLRDSLAVGVDRAILLATDGREWDPMATANAIIKAVQTEQDGGHSFDLLLFGNEAADTGGYQVAIRVAHALGLPAVSGVKGIEIREDGTAVAKREVGGGWEIYEVPLPTVITIKEGINLPRYPSVPGRLRAKRKPLQTIEPEWNGGGLEMIRLKSPPEQGSSVQILDDGITAVPQIVEILKELRLV